MKKRVLLCPNCNSPDNEVHWDNAWAVNTGSFKNFRKCNNCGYVGQLFTEPDSDEPYEVGEDKVKRKYWDYQYKPVFGYILIDIAIYAVLLLFIMIVYLL